MSFPPTPFSQATTPSTGHPSFFGADIILTRTQIAALETETLRLTLSLPNAVGSFFPRQVVIEGGLTARAGQYSVGTLFPEEGTVYNATSYHVIVSQVGLGRLRAGKQVYCSLGPEGSFWLKPTPQRHS